VIKHEHAFDLFELPSQFTFLFPLILLTVPVLYDSRSVEMMDSQIESLVDAALPEYTTAEIASHSRKDDIWIIIHGKGKTPASIEKSLLKQNSL
jgi:hypothetical protein